MNTLKTKPTRDVIKRSSSSISNAASVYYDEAYLHTVGPLEPAGKLSVWRHGHAMVPLVIRPLPEKCGPGFDAISPYDFSGPLLNGEPADVVYEQLCKWAKANGVITAFFRFHPFLADVQSWSSISDLTIVHAGDNVVVLLESREALLADCKPRVSRDVKVTRKAGGAFSMQAAHECDIPAFSALYSQSMRRLQASTYYHFSYEFFTELATTMGPRLWLSEIRIRESLAAGALILVDGDTAYYYLAASNDVGRRACAMNWLIWETAQQLLDMGIVRFHLGGGSPSLHAFKARFSPHRVPYHIGKAVFQADRYAELCGNHTTDYFPAYRNHRFND